MSHGIPCAVCGWNETAHMFPAEYPQCAHPYVSQCDVPLSSEPQSGALADKAEHQKDND